FSSRRRHTRFSRDWSSDVCSSDLRMDDAEVFGYIFHQLTRQFAIVAGMTARTNHRGDFTALGDSFGGRLHSQLLYLRRVERRQTGNAEVTCRTRYEQCNCSERPKKNFEKLFHVKMILKVEKVFRCRTKTRLSNHLANKFQMVRWQGDFQNFIKTDEFVKQV